MPLLFLKSQGDPEAGIIVVIISGIAEAVGGIYLV